jgi:cytochrome c biogenesis protein ResB
VDKALRFLRSRRLAIWLIIVFVAYVAVGTAVPQGEPGSPAVAGWVAGHPTLGALAVALGLSRAYSTPLFLLLSVVLLLNTAVCAWERTRRAWAGYRRDDAGVKRIAERLRDKPTFAMRVSAGRPLETTKVIRSLGLKSTSTDGVTEWRSGAWGAFGSPLFHWSLVGLLLVVGLGQLTRSEGLMGVVVGSAKPDIAASYGVLDNGPLRGEMSGRLVAVPRLERSFSANGVEQGPTPFVELRTASDTLLKGEYVYANHPLRYGATLIHKSADGLAVVVTIGPGGSLGRSEILIDYDETTPSGVQPVTVTLDDSRSVPAADIVFDLPRSRENTVAVAVRYAPVGGLEGADARDAVLVPGDTITLPGDVLVTIEQLTSYARLSIVQDWSVSVIYLLFVLAVVGLTLALFVTPRTLWVMPVSDDSGSSLHVLVRHVRGDSSFAPRVETALRESVESERPQQ